MLIHNKKILVDKYQKIEYTNNRFSIILFHRQYFVKRFLKFNYGAIHESAGTSGIIHYLFVNILNFQVYLN